MYPNPPPPDPPRFNIGDVIEHVVLGPRHQVYLFDYLYVQRGHRRYYCKIIDATLQQHRTRSGRRVSRYVCRCEVRAY